MKTRQILVVEDELIVAHDIKMRLQKRCVRSDSLPPAIQSCPWNKQGMDEISKNNGVLFNPDAADACLRLFKEKDFKFKDKRRKRSSSNK